MQGFIPTIVGHRKEYGELVLETLGPNPENDLIQRDGELVRLSEANLSDEQKEQLGLYERN